MSFFKKNFKLPNLDNIESYAKKFINTIDEQAKNIVNEIKSEENKSRKGQSLEEQYPYPWSDEIDEDTVKNAIVALSMDNRNFLISPASEEDFNFNLNDNIHYAVNLLKFDKRLETLRYNIVPKQIKEDEFWKNYFYRISLIKSGHDIKTLPDIFLPEEIPKAEEPEELKKNKNTTEELFSTDVFDKEEEEELLKDFEKEIGDAIRLEDIKPSTTPTTKLSYNQTNATSTNDQNLANDQDSLSVNDDIDSLDNIGDSVNETFDEDTKANIENANEPIHVETIKIDDLESDDNLSIDETMKELENTLKETNV